MLLIDGDQFLYVCASAVEHEIRWDDQNHVLYSNVEMAWNNLKGMIKRITDRFPEQDEVVLCFSKGPNFRKGVDPTYKANRKDVRRPMCLTELAARAMLEWRCKDMQGLEADDVMGVLATRPGSSPNIIVSHDKDMKTVPATIWDGEHLVTYTEAEADYWHLYQTLVGDASDGYKGCPGVGPVKAEKILRRPNYVGSPGQPEGFISPWQHVVEAFEKSGLTEADALVQARLARILRWSDWDSKKKEPILWQPTPTPSK